MIIGFALDIVRGVRTFRKSLDQLGQTADAKGSTSRTSARSVGASKEGQK